MTIAALTTKTQPAPGTARGARAGGRAGVSTAVLLATAPTGDRTPAGGQPWDDTTVLRRLVDQLADIGLAAVHVITRRGWEDQLERSLAGVSAAVRVHASETIASDLDAVAAIARDTDGGLVVAYGDIVTHREALAGLLADPRVASGILGVGVRRPFTYRARVNRGRVVSAGSPYHMVHRSNASFLGVLKVSAADRPTLVAAARELSALTATGIPERWRAEFERKAGNMRVRLATAMHQDEGDEEGDAHEELLAPEPAVPVVLDPSSVELSPEQAREAEFRRAVAREDAVSLLLTGLVRSGASLATTHVRKLFWARPLSPESIARASENITHYDEEKVLLDSAVKATDGFFTTFFVSPYSKYLARWASRVGLTPNIVTTISVLIGFLAAAAFATGERWGLIAGAVLLQLAFTTDCVDGQLARYTRQFSKLGAWLDSVFDRTKEYAVFAGLAIGATKMGQDVWVLAAAALTLQTVRHSFDFSYAAAQHEVIGAAPQTPLTDPSDLPGATARRATVTQDAAAEQTEDGATPAQPRERVPPARRLLAAWRSLDRMAFMPWLKRMIAFPIGERFAAISITAAIWSPETTFIVLLAWGGFAAAYTLTGRLLRSMLAR